ncbi:MAG: DegT/DnrJ/EryC1/StrS family aminotransferase [Gemmatimonadetes bacterium]|nr:DegT/DnrJ/EryC1/StrS family aminotransferase [Gemmatimonadota bacterium]
MDKPIPVLDLGPELADIWDEVSAVSSRVLRSGYFVGGPEVAGFENEAAAYLGAEHAVALNSGTDALVIGLRALGVERGDEVITSPFTFFASPESIGIVGAREVFADVDLDSFNMDPERVEEAITDRTRALMPVHLFGRPANMDAMMDIASRHGLLVIEDSAQSFGSRLGPDSRYTGRQTGSVGSAGAFSFYPTKNLGGFGDGGLLVTNDGGVADRARRLRDHGSARRYENETLGYNSRLDALQAALLRIKLPRLDANNDRRRAAAARYNDLFAEIEGVVTPDVVPGHVFHQYTIRVTGGRRDAVQAALGQASIGSMIYYPIPCHRLPVYAERGISMPVTELLADEVLSLPLWPAIEEAAQERVRDVIASALR